MKVNLLKNGPLIDKKKMAPILPLIDEGLEGSISQEVLWSCTTCGACMEVCPVSIEHVAKDRRTCGRNLVEMNAKVPDELLPFFESMEQRSNPWGIVPADRIKWSADINVKLLRTGRLITCSMSVASCIRCPKQAGISCNFKDTGCRRDFLGDPGER